MTPSPYDSSSADTHRVGDKLRVRAGPLAGTRGIVDAVLGEDVAVRLNTEDVVHVRTKDVTNFSLAARRAWRVMPKRAGRPPKANGRKKMVSFRLDPDVVELLQRAKESRKLENGSKAVNQWLRERLRALLDE